MGATFADGLAAGAESGDGNCDSDFEAEIFSMEGSIEVDLIIHEAWGGSDGSFFFYEVGEIQFEVSGVGLKALLKGTKDGGDTFDMDEAAVFLEDFEEPTHMCSFELVGEVDCESDCCDGILGGVGPVADDDWVAEAFDADLIDPEVPRIRGRLGIVKGVGAGLGSFSKHVYFNRISLLGKVQGFGFRPLTPHFKSAHAKRRLSAFCKISYHIEVIDSQYFIRLFLITTCNPTLFMRGGYRKERSEPFRDLVSLILYAGVERSWMGVEIDPNGRLVPP